MVTTSNHLLVIMAAFGRGSRHRKRCVGCDTILQRRRPVVMQMPYPRCEHTEVLTTSQDHQERRKPPAPVQLSPAMQSELRKLQHVATRRAGISMMKVIRCAKQANKARSLLQPGRRTADVAAMFTSHTQLVRDDSTSLKSSQLMKMTIAKKLENEPSVSDNESTSEDPTESTTPAQQL